MIEVEIKLLVRSLCEVEDTLRGIGFVEESEITETDRYFDNRQQQIRTNGQAFRIRRILNHRTREEETVITFKGRKMDPISMTRKELEMDIPDGDLFEEVLQELGFYMVPPEVVKYRKTLCRGQISACLDTVKNLGEFLELEIVLPDGSDREAALRELLRISELLGYSIKDTTRTSYLSMLQKVTDEK